MKWITNIIIGIGAISLLSLGGYLAVQDKTSSAATTLGFGFLLVVMPLLAKFRRFKGFGFEAEMWEEKQVEAEYLIDRLKAVSRTLVQQMAIYTANMGLVSMGPAVPIPELTDHLAQLLTILRHVEPETLPDEQLLGPLLRRIEIACCSQAAEVALEALSDELQRLHTDPSPEDLRSYPERIGKLTNLQQALHDRLVEPGREFISDLVQLTKTVPLPDDRSVRLLSRLHLMEEEFKYFCDHRAFRRNSREKGYPWK